MTVAHSAITDPNLHEPKGVAAATSNKVYVSDGAASGTWQKLTASQFNSGAALGGATIVADGAGAASYSSLAEVVTTTNVIVASEGGTTYFLNSATEFVSTLPAPALGLRFKFIVKAAPSGASYTITTNAAATIIVGTVLTAQDAGGTSDSEISGAATITFVDAKAVKGDTVVLECDGTNWYATCTCKVFDGITIS